MGGLMKFDFYYGHEAEQFSFYRIPKLLIKDKRFSGISSDATMLYGLIAQFGQTVHPYRVSGTGDSHQRCAFHFISYL